MRSAASVRNSTFLSLSMHVRQSDRSRSTSEPYGATICRPPLRKFMRGPRGIGFLYASEKTLSRGDHPLYVDMRGARWTGVNQYEVSATARRYEDWEFPIFPR